MRRIVLSALPLLLILFMPFVHVEALGISGLTVTAMDCTGFTLSDYDATYDRDNTGTGSESIEISVRDSDGTLLWLHTEAVALGSYSVPGASYSYDLATPVNGDLTLAYKSLAGNSLEEQTAFTFTGLCSIPTPTPSPTPTATPAPEATASPTANYVLRSTLVLGDTSYDVAINNEVRPTDVAIVGLLTIIASLLMIQFIRDVMKRG